MRVLEVNRVDLVERDELLDLDRAVGLGLEGAELLVGEGHEAILLELIALDDLAPLHHPLVTRAVELLPDAGPAVAVQHVERDLLGVRRHVHPDRDGDEPEADRPGADGARGHSSSFRC